MTQNKNKILDLLNKARYYHNILADEKKAIELCDQILEIDKDNRDALLIKAGSLSHLDKEKEAHYLTMRIIKKWPEHWEAYYLMGMRLFNINEKMAIDFFQKSIKLGKNFNNLISLAQLLYFMEDKTYQKYLDEAKEINPLRFERYMKEYWEWRVC